MLIEQTWLKLKFKLKQFNLKEVNCAVASCPAHQDQRPSLSIEKKKGIILLKCHTGCSFREIVDALGMSSNEFKTRKKLFSTKKRSAITLTMTRMVIFGVSSLNSTQKNSLD